MLDAVALGKDAGIRFLYGAVLRVSFAGGVPGNDPGQRAAFRALAVARMNEERLSPSRAQNLSADTCYLLVKYTAVRCKVPVAVLVSLYKMLLFPLYERVGAV